MVDTVNGDGNCTLNSEEINTTIGDGNYTVQVLAQNVIGSSNEDSSVDTGETNFYKSFLYLVFMLQCT